MQEAERSIRPEGAPTDKAPGSSPSRRGVAPLVAFGVLLVVIAAVVLLVQLTGEDTATPPTTDGGPADTAPATTTLTDEEATAIFVDLARRGLEVQKIRDFSALDSIYTNGGPASDKARRDIEALIDQGVIFQGRVERLSVQVISIKEDELLIRETRLVYPCFVDENGRDVTSDQHVLRQVADLNLRKIGAEWRIHEHVVKTAEQLNRRNEKCP